jgi:hypothetical protein
MSIFRFAVRQCASLALGAVFAIILNATARAGFDSFSVGGDTTAASIQGTVDAFRAALGNPNNGNAPGPVAGGRREINWDGGGSAVSATVGTPFTGFQNRGAIFTTPGAGFIQTPLGDPSFLALNVNYQTTFSTFSPLRIFAPLGSNVTDVDFSLPGSSGAVDATVSGFGAVFSDVDLENATTIEFFGLGNVSLGVFNVPPDSPNNTAPNGGLSFFGAIANAGERIARVRIITGNSPLGPNDQNGDNVDVVVMDDFLYDEPEAVPEPATLALAAVGIAGALFTMRRRK